MAATSGLAALLPGARVIADAYRKAHGEPIAPGQLAVRMRVPTSTAEQILTALNNHTATAAAHNGSRPGVTR